MTRPVEQRFWSKVDRRGPDDCWVWRGARNRRGYGYINRDGKMVAAHVLSWEISHGRAATAFVCHNCDNPPCCNPAHLWLGTSTDNMRDMASKGRASRQSVTHCKHGHEFTPVNTYRRSDRGGTGRSCRTCNRIAAARCRARKHEPHRPEAGL